DSPHRTAGDDAGALRRSAQHHLARAVMADDVVMQGAAFAQRHADHGAARLIGRFADGLRHFARLARAVARATLAVAAHDDRSKAEAPAALHPLGDAVDADELLDKFTVLALGAIAARSAVAIAASARRPITAATAAGRSIARRGSR